MACGTLKGEKTCTQRAFPFFPNGIETLDACLQRAIQLEKFSSRKALSYQQKSPITWASFIKIEEMQYLMYL